MKVPDELKIVMSILLAIVIVIFLALYGQRLGFNLAFTRNFISVLPGLIIIIVGAASLAVVGMSVFAIAGFGIMGVGLSILVDEMNTAGVLIPDILTATFTLPDLQLTILIFFIIIGAIVAAVSK